MVSRMFKTGWGVGLPLPGVSYVLNNLTLTLTLTVILTLFLILILSWISPKLMIFIYLGTCWQWMLLMFSRVRPYCLSRRRSIVERHTADQKFTGLFPNWDSKTFSELRMSAIVRYLLQSPTPMLFRSNIIRTNFGWYRSRSRSASWLSIERLAFLPNPMAFPCGKNWRIVIIMSCLYCIISLGFFFTFNATFVLLTENFFEPLFRVFRYMVISCNHIKLSYRPY